MEDQEILDAYADLDREAAFQQFEDNEVDLNDITRLLGLAVKQEFLGWQGTRL